jgi:hypothetical protein
MEGTGSGSIQKNYESGSSRHKNKRIRIQNTDSSVSSLLVSLPGICHLLTRLISCLILLFSRATVKAIRKLFECVNISSCDSAVYAVEVDSY